MTKTRPAPVRSLDCGACASFGKTCRICGIVAGSPFWKTGQPQGFRPLHAGCRNRKVLDLRDPRLTDAGLAAALVSRRSTLAERDRTGPQAWLVRMAAAHPPAPGRRAG